MISTITELKEYISRMDNTPKFYRVGVWAILFTEDGKAVFLESKDTDPQRAKKLDGVGGAVEENEEDLQKSLLREIKEEIGDVEVVIDDLFSIKIKKGYRVAWWVSIGYLGRIISGKPKNKEPKLANLKILDLKSTNLEDFSEYTKEDMIEYFNRFGKEPYFK